MQSRVMIIVAVGVAALAALFAFRPGKSAGAKNIGAEEVTSASSEPVVGMPQQLEAKKQTHSKAQSGEQPDASLSDASPALNHESYVEKRLDELMELGMNDDKQSLDTILGELTNRDPRIRKAAVEAAVQFGSRDAIPKLSEAALQIDVPEEKTAIADAIDLLKMPSLTEVIAQSSGQKSPVKSSRRVITK